jgi:hypothetical protein
MVAAEARICHAKELEKKLAAAELRAVQHVA